MIGPSASGARASKPYSPATLPTSIIEELAAELGEPLRYASPEHQAFFDSRHLELVASGWMGAGKSRVLCQKAWFVAMTYPGVTVGLFRKAQNSIAATTERTFIRDVVDRRYLAPGYEGRNKSEHWWGLANGSRIYFLGLDPDPITGVPSKVGSLDLGWAGVDEAVELTEDDWSMLLGRLRDPRMDWHQLAAATNPAQPKHWLRVRMTADHPKRKFISITANRYLPPEYMDMLADLPDTAAGKRLGKGLWVAAEGAIWSLPDAQIVWPQPVVIKPGVGSPYQRVIGGIDWGFVHAFAAEVIGQSGSGRLVVADELYEKGKTLPMLIPRLLELQAQWGVETWYADPSEPAYIADCRAAGLRVQEANNDVDPGIQAVATAIKHGMTISPACGGLLDEITGYVWAPNRAGGLKEVPLKEHDDACDALRYAVMGLRSGWQGASDVAVA